MRKVLIVDDEKMIVNSLVLGFSWREHGCEVVGTASSGREALPLVEGLHPDIVFTDIKMPGMTGLELMSQCRERAPGAVFVVISGHAEFAFAQRALALGAAAYCLKPLEDEEIASALVKAGQLLSRADELRRAALLRFLDSPTLENARLLLAPLGISGHAALALSLGDARPLLSGFAPCADFALSDKCALYIIPGDASRLESYAFRASLLGAVSAGTVSAFVYEETDNPARCLPEALPGLLDQLYAGFFSPERAVLGRAQPPEARDEAWLTAFQALCNKNRLLEACRALEGAQAVSLAMSDAVRVNNLCEALLCRHQNRPAHEPLRYAFELAACCANFASLRASLARRLRMAGGGAADPEKLHNETLARVVQEINQSFTRDLPFQTLCARYGMNPSYLSQLFKKELDIPFTGYVNRLRIGYAKELLEGTSMRVSEISDRVGYDNYLTFTKLFKKETGLTPKGYRAECRGEPPASADV